MGLSNPIHKNRSIQLRIVYDDKGWKGFKIYMSDNYRIDSMVDIELDIVELVF